MTPAWGTVRGHKAHLEELKKMDSDKELRRSKYFVMTKHVHRTQQGRGSKFQNHKVSSYKITSAMNRWSSAWSPSDTEVSKLIRADFIRDTGRLVWKFYDRRSADKAWVLLAMKYGG